MKIELDLCGVSQPPGYWQQSLARSESKIISGEGIIAKVYLCRQRPISGSFDKEMDMRRSATVTAQSLHQPVRRPLWRNAVSRRHSGMEPVGTS